MSNELQNLVEIEKIKQLKYRYFRHLDSKQFSDIIELFTDDATTAYDNGRHSYQGREQIFKFLDESMTTPDSLTAHQAHHPEITVIDENHATGIWHFEDTVHRLDFRVLIFGAGIYWDEYVKVDGQWKIAHTGYERLWVRTEKIDEDRLLEIRSMWSTKDIVRSNQRTKKAAELALFPQRDVPSE